VQKIPTLFVRDPDTHAVTDAVHPDCQWVLDGEGTPTRKWDGVCVKFDPDHAYWKRQKDGSWTPVGAGPEDRWHREALERVGTLPPGTYELCGPKINGNHEHAREHTFYRHGAHVLTEQSDTNPLGVPRDYAGLWTWLLGHDVEGIVWHHPDGRMAKLKGRDFPHRPSRTDRRQTLAKLTAAAGLKDRRRRRCISGARPAGYDGHRPTISSVRAAKTTPRSGTP
jgi:hypothetical protein